MSYSILEALKELRTSKPLNESMTKDEVRLKHAIMRKLVEKKLKTTADIFGKLHVKIIDDPDIICVYRPERGVIEFSSFLDKNDLALHALLAHHEILTDYLRKQNPNKSVLEIKKEIWDNELSDDDKRILKQVKVGDKIVAGDPSEGRRIQTEALDDETSWEFTLIKPTKTFGDVAAFDAQRWFEAGGFEDEWYPDEAVLKGSKPELIYFSKTPLDYTETYGLKLSDGRYILVAMGASSTMRYDDDYREVESEDALVSELKSILD